MRLPGTRYQEPGWEQVRKLLGQCSLQAFARGDTARLIVAGEWTDALAVYVDQAARALRAGALTARAQAAGNSYGDTVFELSLVLLYELQARPGDWETFCHALARDASGAGASWLRPGGEALLRKKVNDMYAVLRDKVDADNYQAACGKSCSPNRMYAYRMLDTARGEVVRLFAAWREHREQVGAILGRTLEAEPIEARQLANGGPCKALWLLRWSETLERFTGASGPLHTRSKRFEGLKDSPAKIDAMLREIEEYESLSCNRDHDWALDAGEAAGWLEDYWRVLSESEAAAAPGPDRILEAVEDELDCADAAPADDSAPAGDEADKLPDEVAARVSLPPGYLHMASLAQDRAAWAARVMDGDSMPVRIAVYLKLLGPADDTYPAEWLDPATGELPTMQQLAALDRISLPTLRKRRDAAIARLSAARP